jgi:gliding motility-associated-like protein
MPAWVVALTAEFTFDNVCSGNATTLISRSTPRDSIRYLLWDLNGDGKFGDASGDTIVFTFPATGYHNVGLKALTYSGQSTAVYHLVGVGELSVDFSYVAGCSTQPTTFTDRSVVVGDEVSEYTWNFGDGSPQSHDRNGVHTYTSSGQFPVKFRIVTIGGCIDSTSQTLIIGNPPAVNLVFTGDTVLAAGDSVIVSVQGVTDSLLWSTGKKTIAIVIKQAGNYWVKAYLGGCFVQKNFRIRTTQYGTEPVIATLFTPNGDGFNDYWEILNLAKVSPCDVTVYSRNGQKVFSSPDYQNNWDGMFGSRLLANDTYYYFVRCFDQVQHQGTVNILK